MCPFEITSATKKIKSSNLKREVDYAIYKPANLKGNEVLNLLLLNDGQEAEALRLGEMLGSLLSSGFIDPVVVVAVKASEERMYEYGVSGIPDYLKRGAKAQLYADFLIYELLPVIEKKVMQPINGSKAIAGFSLGGLSAFDVAWKHPEVFNAVGVFSGSFWWRRKGLHEDYLESDRIMHDVVRNTAGKPALKFWIMTGTDDEKEDRNNNYIIDSIDDAIDLIKELYSKGYKRTEDVRYYEMVGGKHDVSTWAKAMPAFLIWAFPHRTYFDFPNTLA